MNDDSEILDKSVFDFLLTDKEVAVLLDFDATGSKIRKVIYKCKS